MAWDVRGEILDVGPPPGDRDDEPGDAGGGRRRRTRALAVAVLAVVFALGVTAGWVARGASRPAGAAAPAVRFSLGADPGGPDGVRDGQLVVVVNAVATNEGTTPVSVTGLRVRGAGAGVTDRFAGPLHNLPVLLRPGETRNLPFALTTECSLPTSAVPAVTVVVRDDRGTRWSLDARIPDLDVLWGESRTPAGCAGA